MGKSLQIAVSLLLAVLLEIGAGTFAFGAETIKIGVIYPLSGNTASAGNQAKAGIELAAEIVNGDHPEFEPLPLAKGAGLPGLKGALLELVIADHQGNPSVGQSQTLRLITQEKVVAMMGSYESSVSMTATAVAERYGIPFLVGDSVAADITGRGFKSVFRTTPIASDLARTYMDFFAELKSKKNAKVESLAIVNENTDYGTSTANAIEAAAVAKGFKVLARIPYGKNTADVSSQVLQLKQLNPDVAIFISYTSDAILYVKTMQNLNYKPPICLGEDAGFSDPATVEAVSGQMQGLFNRSAWTVGKPGSLTYRLNVAYKKKVNQDISDPTARSIMGFLTLADAINRAGSTKPEAIIAALKATDLKANQMMVGYSGVQFDPTGQNKLAATFVTQLFGKDYLGVWPFDRAERDLVYPYKGW
jgi:branched-chain amino acid transport system substrate-binding protein